MSSKKFETELTTHVRACQTAFAINSREETRVIEAVRRTGWLLGSNELAPHRFQDFDELNQIDLALTAGGVIWAAKPEYEPNAFVTAFETLSKWRSEPETPPEEAEEQASKNDEHVKTLRQAMDVGGYATICWDQVTGFLIKDPASKQLRAAASDLTSNYALLDAFDLVQADNVFSTRRALFVMKDAHRHLGSVETPIYRRGLRNLCEDNRLVANGKSKHLVFLQPYMKVHEDLRHVLTQLEFPLPDDEDIQLEVISTQNSIMDQSKSHCPEALATELTRSLRGLEANNISKSLGYTVVQYGGFDVQMAKTIRALRSRQLSAANGLRIYDPDGPELSSLGELGGYENVRALVDEVRLCRTPEAVKLGLPAPNGMVIGGLPGVGKSVAAKLCAKWLEVPLLELNMGTAKGGIVGESEANMNASIEIARSVGECVLMLDEWDKQAGGSLTALDGNTSAGMLSLLLGYAADPNRKSFLVFTINRLTCPLESLRSGRVSAFFYAGLPDAADREEILTIKIAELRVKAEEGCLRAFALSEHANNLSGAELTDIAQKAVRAAFMRDRKKLLITGNDLKAARELTTPVSLLDPAQMRHMAEYAANATPVSRKGKTQGRSLLELGLAPGKKQIKLNN